MESTRSVEAPRRSSMRLFAAIIRAVLCCWEWCKAIPALRKIGRDGPKLSRRGFDYRSGDGVRLHRGASSRGNLTGSSRTA